MLRTALAIVIPGLAFLILPGLIPNRSEGREASPRNLELLKTFDAELVSITPGEKGFPDSFVMGTEKSSASEQPAHRVTFTDRFSISKYEVPQNLYEAVMGNNPSKWKGPRNSVEMFSFDDAQEFCTKITVLLRDAELLARDEEIRLPTEAEWEYCCRAGTNTAYSFGDSAAKPGDKDTKTSLLDEFAWHTGNAAGNDPPIGAKQPNAWGLYDMHGYLWEFVSDPWHETYAGAPVDGSRWTSNEKLPRRTLRSGSWKDRPEALRSAHRRPFDADAKDDAVGIRCVKAAVSAVAEAKSDPQFIDLSLLVAPELPGPWPAGWPAFQINHYERIGPLSPYNSDILVIDGNNGTQLDVPPHSIPLPETNLPNAGVLGRMFTDKVAPWQFGGEACVVDCRDLLDAAANGDSPLVKRERIAAWERKNRPLGTGDVVLFYSGYTDKYYKPLPEGRRFIAEPLEAKTPAWPDPDPDCMEYLGSRKVMTLGTDSASMGPLPNLAEPTHIAGLKYGMIWAESVTNLGKLPVTGAFYCMIGPKHAEGLYSEARAFAIVGDPLAKRLIDSARKKNVIDLSVTLSTDLPVSWPGSGVGQHRHPYLKVPLMYAANLATYHVTHMLDSNSGTHLVPPAYALPPAGFDNGGYSAEVKGWLAEYEAKYGRRGTSGVTAEQVPLAQTCGRARVIDVKHLVGTTEEKNWPASPEITVEDLKKFEARDGDFKAGDVVIFFSGHNDKHFKPLGEGSACLADPLNGKREGWPAPGPDAVMYLAGKGIRCVATDGPTLGGVSPQRALFTYWALGSKGIVGVEFLIGAGQIPTEAYFVFAPVKIRDCHGGPGRALAFF